MEGGERPADMNHLCQIKHRRSQTKTNGTKNKQNHPNLTPQISPLISEPVKPNPSYGNLELFLDMDWVRNNEKIGSNRMRFILECLKDLDATLKQMGTRLFVLRGDSTTVIRKFCRGNFYDLWSYAKKN